MAKEPKDWTVKYSDQAKAKMASDPDAAEFVRDVTSQIRQALHDFELGKYGSVDEALSSIGMQKADPDGDS